MLKFFKITALLEGISLLSLLFFAMPMKYMFQMPIFVKYVGMTHGLLFIGYIILATMIKIEDNWKVKKYFEVCVASIVPFGTFYIEKKYLKNV